MLHKKNNKSIFANNQSIYQFIHHKSRGGGARYGICGEANIIGWRETHNKGGERNIIRVERKTSIEKLEHTLRLTRR
jgi:hypothetical protein